MFEQIIIYIVLFFISFFPIVIWAYIFSYIDDNPLNKKRFFFWLISWAISVIPILYMDKILEILNVKFLNIFYYISQIWDLFSSIKFGFSLIMFFIIIVWVSFILWGFIYLFKRNIHIYLRNVFIFIIFIIILSFIVYLFNIWFSPFDFEISAWLKFWELLFNSLKLIIFYYLLVAFIEETSKHFNFLQSSVFYITSIKTWVLYAIFIALWFGLVENILYLNANYQEYWITFELLKIYFFRSVFSLIVHILCSSVVWYYFTKAYILYRDHDLSFPYLKIFSFWILLSILLHLIFDVSLTLWFSFIMFIYFIWGYLYVSSIFYRE